MVFFRLIVWNAQQSGMSTFASIITLAEVISHNNNTVSLFSFA